MDRLRLSMVGLPFSLRETAREHLGIPRFLGAAPQQSTEGSSKPSVRAAQLATTRVASVCNRWRIARRVASGGVPSSASAGMPAIRKVSAMA